MESSATGRYGVPDAPGGLALVQTLLNTVARPTRTVPPGPDLLDDAALAQPWADAVVSSLGGETTPLSRTDLVALRELRDALRRGLADADDGSSDPFPAVSQTVSLVLGPGGGVDVAASGGPTALIRGAVLGEALQARASGELARLKLCAHPRCRLAFYDVTRNRSARFHSARCANLVHLAHSRERRRAGR